MHNITIDEQRQLYLVQVTKSCKVTIYSATCCGTYIYNCDIRFTITSMLLLTWLNYIISTYIRTYQLKREYKLEKY